MISFTSTGSFSRTEAFLSKMKRGDLYRQLDAIAKRGVAALAAATPVESGVTAASWDYKIQRSSRHVSITWSNSHTNNGVPIAILLQYGHGTGTGGYVRGRDYINPALKPIFDQLADNVWKAVTTA